MAFASMPNAEIIAAGSELLTPRKIDTNSLWLTQELNDLGVEVVRKSVVGDDRERMTETIRGALARTGIVILTGGLGPTEDDVTRDAAAAALDRPLILHPEIVDAIAEIFRKFERKMADNNKRQAYVIEGAEILKNPRGTAPGQWVESNGAVVMLLPGPPHELKPLFTKECRPRLEKMLPKQVIRTRFYRVAGMGESDLDQLIAPVYSRYTNPATTILAAAGDIQIHLRARCAEEQEAETLLNEVTAQLEPLLGDRIYTKTGEALECVVGDLLRKQHAKLAVVESCTGGMLGERITSVAKSSEFFVGGFITYNNQMKARLVDVQQELLWEHSAVSERVAWEMAKGAKYRTGAEFALSVTGFAGPEGGTEKDPVGTVYIGLAGLENCLVRRFVFPGDRSLVRQRATQTALDLLRKVLETL